LSSITRPCRRLIRRSAGSGGFAMSAARILVYACNS
jgi:hypothetical protein